MVLSRRYFGRGWFLIFFGIRMGVLINSCFWSLNGFLSFGVLVVSIWSRWVGFGGWDLLRN